MKRIFVDTSFYIGLLHGTDQYHELAIETEKQLLGCQVYTSEMVLTEALNGLSKFGPWVKNSAVSYVRKLQNEIYVVEQSHDLFEQALKIYQRYRDKGWGLTDCSSFLIMEELAISDVLSTDVHFKQMGRTNLML